LAGQIQIWPIFSFGRNRNTYTDLEIFMVEKLIENEGAQIRK
jgi:hypothetical protein